MKTQTIASFKLEEQGLTQKVAYQEEAASPMCPLDQSAGGVILQCFPTSRELLLLRPAVCGLVAKVCRRAPCRPSGQCVYGLVLHAFLGLCLNNGFMYMLKLNCTLSILFQCITAKFYTQVLNLGLQKLLLLFLQSHDKVSLVS